MSTKKIEVKGGLFVDRSIDFSTNMVNEVLTREVDTNGFRGTIREDGVILVDRYKGDGGVYLRIYPDGNYKVTNSDGTTRRGHLTLDSDGHINCTIGVHSDTMHKWAYVRDSGFQQWLEERGITRVERRDPNGEFSGTVAFTASGSEDFDVKSDGNTEYTSVYRDDWEKMYPGTSCYEGKIHYTVTGGSWTIVKTSSSRNGCHSYDRVLYTLVKDVTTLDIPVRVRQ